MNMLSMMNFQNPLFWKFVSLNDLVGLHVSSENAPNFHHDLMRVLHKSYPFPEEMVLFARILNGEHVFTFARE